MADTKISALTLKGTPVGADTYTLVDSVGGANKKCTLATMIAAGLLGVAGGRILIGGTAVTDTLKLQGTSGNGTATAIAIQNIVGNNGGTVATTILNNGYMGIAQIAPEYPLHITVAPSSSILTGLTLHSTSTTIGDGVALDFRCTTTAANIGARIAGLRQGSGGLSEIAFYTLGGDGLTERMRLLNNSSTIQGGTGGAGIWVKDNLYLGVQGTGGKNGIVKYHTADNTTYYFSQVVSQLSGQDAVVDNTLNLGWNVSGANDTGEPKWYTSYEANWKQNGQYYSEYHLEYEPNDGVNPYFRPISVNVNRTTRVANVALNGQVQIGPTTASITAAGAAIPITKGAVEITTDGSSSLNNGTLADGVAAGQTIMIYCKVAGNAADSFKITPTTMLGGTIITFAASPVGKGCIMIWTTAGWVVIGNNGGTIS